MRQTARHHNHIRLIICMALGFLPFHAPTSEASEEDAMVSCMEKMLRSAPDSMTVGRMRSKCRNGIPPAAPTTPQAMETSNAVEKRRQIDRENILKPFTIMAHRQNFFLFAAHNLAGYSAAEYNLAEGRDDLEIEQTETQFQLSIKTPLAVDLFGSDVDIFAAYTVRSFWQFYDYDRSSPFRETNHEPETWLQMNSDLEMFGWKNVANLLGLSHQSNGKSQNLSRSWNRVYADFIFHKGDFAFSVKPWIRIQEDSDDDDNPDITDYLGHGELGLAYKLGDHTFTLMSRNNLESGFSKGAVKLGWSFPLFEYPFLKGYIHYFFGYGESLIDYDRYVNKVGFGILLTDLL